VKYWTVRTVLSLATTSSCAAWLVNDMINHGHD
jgi:hypothetical protein